MKMKKEHEVYVAMDDGVEFIVKVRTAFATDVQSEVIDEFFNRKYISDATSIADKGFLYPMSRLVKFAVLGSEYR